MESTFFQDYFSNLERDEINFTSRGTPHSLFLSHRGTNICPSFPLDSHGLQLHFHPRQIKINSANAVTSR